MLCIFSKLHRFLLVAVCHPFLFCIFCCLKHLDLASSVSDLCEARHKPVPSQLTGRPGMLDAHSTLFPKERFWIKLISLGAELYWLVGRTDAAKVKLLILPISIQLFLMLHSSEMLHLTEICILHKDILVHLSLLNQCFYEV